MKKKTTLQLKKVTLANLDEPVLNKMAGGTDTQYMYCPTPDYCHSEHGTCDIPTCGGGTCEGQTCISCEVGNTCETCTTYTYGPGQECNC